MLKASSFPQDLTAVEITRRERVRSLVLCIRFVTCFMTVFNF